MPKVVSKSGTKHFPYTAKGEKQAKNYAHKSGGKLEYKKGGK